MHKEESIDHHLRATWQAVSKMYNEQASKQNATMATGFVLLNIDCETGTSSTSLGPKMGMEATSLSRILKNMQDKGVIYREKNPKDGRGVIIKLTEFGKEKRALARTFVLRFNSVVKENVTEEQLINFFQVMRVINSLIKDKVFFVKG